MRGYNSFQTEKGNVIWAAALGLAWNQLKEKHAHENIALKSTSGSVREIVKNFNQCKFTQQDIGGDCFLVASGFGQKAVKEINQKLKKKFPSKTTSTISSKLAPSDIICYAYLFKNIEFQTKFTKRDQNIFLFNKVRVPSFYAKNINQKKQIICHDYDDKDNFCVSIKSKTDVIYLIKTEKKLTVAECIQIVTQIKEEEGSPLRQNDYFQMPLIELDCTRRMNELIKCQFANKALKDMFIGEIIERVKLNVDQSGVKLQNQAKIIARKCKKASSSYQPKFIILERSFWLLMREEGKHPYLCAFINTIQQ